MKLVTLDEIFASMSCLCHSQGLNPRGLVLTDRILRIELFGFDEEFHNKHVKIHNMFLELNDGFVRFPKVQFFHDTILRDRVGDSL